MSCNLLIPRRRTLWAVLLILGLTAPALAFAQTPPAEILHGQARAYVTSYLRRKAEAAGS